MKFTHDGKEYLYRIPLLRGIFVFLIIAIMAKLGWLQLANYGAYRTQADKQQQYERQLMPPRGIIWARAKAGTASAARPQLSGDLPRALKSEANVQFFPLATNRTLYYLYGVPKDITREAHSATVDTVARITNLDKGMLATRLEPRDSQFAALSHGITPEMIEALKQAQLKGIGWQPESARLYPEGEVGANILGFVDRDGNGQYGLEQYFDDELKGIPGYLSTTRDARGQIQTDARSVERPAVPGTSFVLTLDHTVEVVTCDKLAQAVKRYHAERGSVVTMDPNTGAIIAMCTYPSFDPNTYNTVKDLSVFQNLAITGAYEPGSIFKSITVGSALDAGRVTPQTQFTDTGSVRIAGYTIHNAADKVYGLQTIAQALQYSINLGMIFTAEQLGQELFTQYVRAFGFGQKTGIELAPESPGDVSALDTPSEISTATASFGQGITVTPLQMATAYAAIANGGKLMKPYLIAERITADGAVIKTPPTVIRQVMSAASANALTAMLISVTEEGHAKGARIAGYYVAGKTGTAQVPDPVHGGYSDKTIQSFAAFAPADNPAFVSVVRLDNPNTTYAESSATPLFEDIASFMLHYFNIPPSRTHSSTTP